MDEYFCPNCGAILNEQWGFNPEVSTWTCTECGKLLMDDEIYDGDNYEGVAWFCDNCGALLNKQSGFTDSYSSWTCTECYHSNPINEDVIYDSEKEINKGCCPDCGENLEDQFGCYPEGCQTCYCGKTLYFCEYCHELLNSQDGFYDDCEEWICSECGTDNEITGVNEEDNECYPHSNSNNQTYYTSNNSSTYQTKNKDTTQYNKKRPKRKRKWKVFFAIILILTGVSAFGYYEFTKMIPTGYSNEELEGLRYTVVVEKLKESGFTDVKEKEIQDLTISREDEEKMVTDVKLGWTTFFDETTKYPSNLRVTVVYHTVETYSPPLTSKEIKNMNYEDVISSFEDAGFINIKTEVEYDIVTGWISEDGEVKSVTIDGDKKFDSSDKYRLDAEVIVTYHTLRKNKPKD